jgi:hypothetical protein
MFSEWQIYGLFGFFGELAHYIVRRTCPLSSWFQREEERGNEKKYSAGILEQSMGARNRVGIRLSYRPSRLQKPAWAPLKLKNSDSGSFLSQVYMGKGMEGAG